MDVDFENERLDKYHKGGFCPIDLGDRIADRFVVLYKLGYGGFRTVWLTRDEEGRHGRYVALKVVSAASSDEYESPAVIEQVHGYERDRGYPGLFLLELERVFHTSRNGRHLCQVFPVLGPTLSTLNAGRYWLYASFVKRFAYQLATALDAMHSLGVCHGDFILKNVAVRLDKSLDTLTEEQLSDIFPKMRRQSLDAWFRDSPSPGPKYAVKAIKLSRLPVEFFKFNDSKLCIYDFDQAFMTHSPPEGLAHIPPAYLAPESIFSLTNGPEADIWALGSILFGLRAPATTLFWDSFTSGPLATAIRMGEILGNMPEEWYTLPFVNNYPVHGTLHPDDESHRLKDMRTDGFTLEQLVHRIVDPRRPSTGVSPKTGAERFCIKVPQLDILDEKVEEEFKAKHTTPIRAQDAEDFIDLLRRIFTYDHRKRITAKEILEHPWLAMLGPRSAISAVTEVARENNDTALLAEQMSKTHVAGESLSQRGNENE